MAKRIFATVPDEFFVKFMVWCDRLAVSQAQLGGMAMQAGFDSILRAVSPIDSIEADKLAEIVQAMQLRGMDVSGIVGPGSVSKPKPHVLKMSATKKAVKSS